MVRSYNQIIESAIARVFPSGDQANPQILPLPTSSIWLINSDVGVGGGESAASNGVGVLIRAATVLGVARVAIGVGIGTVVRLTVGVAAAGAGIGRCAVGD